MNPVPQFGVNSWKLPVPDMSQFGKDVILGFDYFAADWVHPVGKGKHADWIVTLIDEEMISSGKYADVSHPSFQIKFADEGAGFIKMPASDGLRSPYFAEDGGYQPVYIERSINTFSRSSSISNYRDELEKIVLIFRIKNRNGPGFHYGKMYHGINYEHKWGKVLLNYGINPVVNDRNIEFDPSKSVSRDILESLWGRRIRRHARGIR